MLLPIYGIVTVINDRDRMKKVVDANAAWIYLAPISNVNLCEHSSYKIVQAELVRESCLTRRRKKFGFNKKISELKKRNSGFLNDFFLMRNLFLHLRCTGVGTEMKGEFGRICDDELYILASSQLGYGSRNCNAFPCITDRHKSGKVSFLLFNSEDNSWMQQNCFSGKYNVLALDKRWSGFHDDFYFHKLLKILRGEIWVKSKWKKILYDASVLIGMSQCSNDKTSAFLWNMVAIEMLLAQSDDKYLEAIPERIEAFLGWVFDWEVDKYDEKIGAAYQKRCKIVHEGNRSLVGPEDLYFTDGLLFNLLTNLVRHHEIFNCKQAIKDFCEKVKAEKLLGIPSKVRPKTLLFTKTKYREQEYDSL